MNRRMSDRASELAASQSSTWDERIIGLAHERSVQGCDFNTVFFRQWGKSLYLGNSGHISSWGIFGSDSILQKLRKTGSASLSQFWPCYSHQRNKQKAYTLL
ncbi:hypothetical protein AMECASPLE_032253 [Ameca splendens]|uniref:Uncharacterized protein n=1 Tax=Ameca splendens TaxID=208324 RepID=A0ABV0XJK1_9TELE